MIPPKIAMMKCSDPMFVGEQSQCGGCSDVFFPSGEDDRMGASKHSLR